MLEIVGNTIPKTPFQLILHVALRVHNDEVIRFREKM